MDEDPQAVQLLIDDLKSDEVEARVAAMRRLTTVAAALGPDRTVGELVPFLAEQVEDDDEVLLIMAEQLGEFIPLVGGHEKAVCLLDILGSLATVEETVVRDQAVESTNSIVEGLSSGSVEEYALPVIERLTNGDWFTSRVSASGLFASAYGQLANEDAKAKLRGLYKSLCEDDTPMVRRAASKNIGNFAKKAEKHYVTSELLPLFEVLANDDQDSVRLLAIENCTKFATLLDQADNKDHILPLVRTCAEDKSWRVRNNVAREFHELSAAIGSEVTIEFLLSLFVRLLQDPEAEVRASAAKNVAGYCELIGSEYFISNVVPTLRDLASDLAQNVRVNLAESIMDALSKLSAAEISQHLVNHITLFMRDTVPEVRLKVLLALDKLIVAVDSQTLQNSILPSILSLCADQQWRVRECVIEQMPLLADSLGESTFDSKLFPHYLNALTDQVSSVRSAATRTLAPLGRQMGTDWCLSKLVPKLRDLYDGAHNYLGRITVLYGIQYLFSEPSLSEIAGEVVPILLRSTRDSVPNVRFVAAKVIREIAHALDAGCVSSEVKPCLAELETDNDKDVKYFASAALAACG